MDAQVSDRTPIDIQPDAQSGLGVVPGLLWAFRIHNDGTADALAVAICHVHSRLPVRAAEAAAPPRSRATSWRHYTPGR